MKLRTCLIALSLMFVAASTASAISPGPGGRLYSNYASTTLGGIVVGNYLVANDWSTGAFEDMAILKETLIFPTHHYRQEINPTLVKHAGTGYGTITFGLWGTGAPLSHNPKNTNRSDGGDPGAAAHPVMNIVQMTAFMSNKWVGSGRAFTLETEPSTDGGHMAWYDRSGMLTGTKGQYYYEGAWGWDECRAIIGYKATGDITANVSDYPIFKNRVAGDGYYPNGHAQLGNRIYTQSAGGVPGITPGGRYMYYTKVETGNINSYMWYDPSDDPGKPKLTDLSVTAPTKLTVNGAVHDVVFTYATVGTELCIVKTVDLNNDGDANDEGESSRVFGNNFSAIQGDGRLGLVAWDGYEDGARSLEFVRGPQGNNFLIYNCTKFGGYMGVIELNADGSFKGDNVGVDPLNYWRCTPTAKMGSAIELDYYVPGDANTDYVVNGQDIFGFLKSLTSESAFWAAMPTAKTIQGTDVNEDGVVNGQDIKPFLDALAGIVPTAAPEPATMTLLGLAGVALLRRRK